MVASAEGRDSGRRAEDIMSLFSNFLRKKIPFDEPVLETVTLTFSNVPCP
jgi:hypothetical protein